MPVEHKDRKRFFHSRLSISKYGPFSSYMNILIGYIDTLIIFNLFFILTSIAIITFGPSMATIYACYEDLVNNRNERRYRSYFKHFIDSFTSQNIILGILILLLYSSLIYAILFFYINLKKSIYLAIPLFVSCFFILIINRFSGYYFLGMAKVKLNKSIYFKNAILLSMTNIKSILIVDVGFIIQMVLPCLFFEYTFPILILLSFSGTMLSNMMAIYANFNKYVVLGPKEDFSEVKDDSLNLRLDLIAKKDSKKKESQDK